MTALAAPSLLPTDGVVRLRPPRPADAEALVAACQDPEIPRWTTVPSPYRLEDARAFIAAAAAATPGGPVRFVLVDAGTDALLGTVSLVEVDREREEAEAGYWLAREARGRGAATRGLVLLRDWARHALGIRRLRLHIHVENVASRRVAERAGFAATGELRPCPRGCSRRADHAVYAWAAGP